MSPLPPITSSDGNSAEADRAAGARRPVMPFGKYKGLPLAVVPPDYLRWLLGQPGLRVGRGLFAAMAALAGRGLVPAERPAMHHPRGPTMSIKAPSEAALVKAVLGYLRVVRRWPAWRNQTGALRVGRRLVRFGEVGSADVLGLIPPGGRLLAVE